ncbi:hypothetical protein [Carnobacterium viridans]|uniref:Uncharacterized protein n=1 Tax=Carnobacterium viridans TaxID=174587 RepID=A0A1H0Y2I1_9LACT|nr:hypothetical protein [Carnobacterium viridans]SDQ09374.1 hypothetical protein SAMN04487752_0658 [Carnobacterium viridans]
MLILLLAIIGLCIFGWSWSKMGGIAEYWVNQGVKDDNDTEDDKK